MDKWARISFDLVKGKFYLDKLLEIYPAQDLKRGEIDNKHSLLLKEFFYNKDCFNLIKQLILLKKKGFKFPIENSYISFLTHNNEAIEKNPKTAKIICDELFKMTFQQIKVKIESPKKSSRRIGPMFKSWLKKNFEFSSYDQFFESKHKIIFLDGTDKTLKKFAEKDLKCVFKTLSKGLDFLAKANQKFIIGSAKFITDFGGSQDNQFNEVISLIKETKCLQNVYKVAIIDGVPWLRDKIKKIVSQLKNNEFCFSALVLKDFLNQL